MVSVPATLVEPAPAPERLPRHVAIIMDGNGRWARARGLPRVEGHRRGVEVVRRAVRYAGTRGIEVLTLFSFSSENWSRPEAEIQDLLNLLRFFIRRDLAELKQNGVRVRVIGERASLPEDIRELIALAEAETAENSALQLQVAFNYGARDEIVRAARRIAERVAAGEMRPQDISQDVFKAHLDTGGMPDPDLVIRTSGEKRISNFLLWQAAYAEFVFLPVLWPDFGDPDFEAALREFAGRERRFGGVVGE
ncbi:isoprenyl transferase [Faunimonas sp. B44]|uniref:isoprenyl transferase n=1 Tax=Faunimonas sp. B44 TaxID=3461493 RepID=UPI0040446190